SLARISSGIGTFSRSSFSSAMLQCSSRAVSSDGSTPDAIGRFPDCGFGRRPLVPLYASLNAGRAHRLEQGIANSFHLAVWDYDDVICQYRDIVALSLHHCAHVNGYLLALSGGLILPKYHALARSRIHRQSLGQRNRLAQRGSLAQRERTRRVYFACDKENIRDRYVYYVTGLEDHFFFVRNNAPEQIADVDCSDNEFRLIVRIRTDVFGQKVLRHGGGRFWSRVCWRVFLHLMKDKRNRTVVLGEPAGHGD